MNFGEFSPPVCAALKPRHNPIDYPGTANVSCAHRMREPNSNCRYVKQFYELRKSTEIDPTKELEDRQLVALNRRFAFEKRTDKRVLRENIRRSVEQGMMAYEDGINKRREKLRAMILVEEAAFTKEIVDQAQHGGDSKINEMRARVEELRKKHEEEHQATVAAKRMQQYLTCCLEAREKKTQKLTRDAKLCNLAQMAENEAKRKAERELDALWHCLMLKEVEAKKGREIEEARRRELTTKMVRGTLDDQIAGLRALEAEGRQVKAEQQEALQLMWENIRKEEQRNLDRENYERQRLKRELEDQLMKRQKILAERAAEEKAMDLMFKELGEAELDKEKNERSSTAERLRREMFAYLSNLEAIREEEARRNAEVDAIVEESNRNVEARRTLAIRKFKEARERSLREVMAGREAQMKEKQEREEREKSEKEREALLLQKELDLDAKLNELAESQKKERARHYGLQLKAQQSYVDAVRRRDKEEAQRMYQDGIKREEEYQRQTKLLLEASEHITPHAFKTLLKECAARHDAEQKGQCYCPPPPPPPPPRAEIC
ncbi:calponin homology domain-containing protein DDB_G0272472-like [Neodiprion lecontei]|uniref:Calponin homology domain-containing protein DDB_G0272472-like n=1 Tax=Neodiprion lecontei TaxID=441921 RepID=A0A6J0B3D0_NEOLC|nr:calponin homology domain-containing protein DDB_G0272472-like [Neodiprion lecontei]